MIDKITAISDGCPVPYATTNGVRLFYETHGSRSLPPLLMIRGLARSSRFWLDFPERLLKHFYCITFDNRGVGYSDAPLPPYTTQVMADDAAAVLAEVDVPRAHIFGISLGGMIAQQFALRHPKQVDRLVLGCTTHGGRNAIATPFNAVVSLLGGATKTFEQTMKSTASVVLSEKYLRSHPEIIDSWQQIARNEPPPMKGLVGQFLAGAAHNTASNLHRIQRPTLCLTGSADRLILPDNSRRIAQRIHHGRVHFLVGAGHDFPTEQPGETADVLRDFFLG